ncbi:MAG: TolC family protein [Endomicrobium sp.]|jgi:outer membrane protein TolC|nr:TolC family protein [Endomicrobium sp.]
MSILIVRCDVLTIDKYMDEVLKNNNNLKSIHSKIESLKVNLAEKERIYSYYLTTEMDCSEDFSRKHSYNPSSVSDKVQKINFSTNINRQFPATGTKFTLGIRNCNFIGSSNNNSSLSSIGYSIELEQSLFKNIVGIYTKTEIEKIKANLKSDLYKLEYEKQNILLKARFTYWDLSYLRTVINFKRLSLNRTRKILEWNQKKYSMDLVEKSDLLQAQLALKSKELSLQLLCEEEQKIKRQFNQFLNISSPQIDYEIEKFKSKNDILKDLPVPNKKNTRYDVLSALECVKTAFYEKKLARKRMGADLVLKGQYKFISNKRSVSKAFKSINRDSCFLELRYLLPLDFKLRKSIEYNYGLVEVALEKFAEYTMIQENNDWVQLVSDFENSKKRFGILIEVEKIQRQKYEEDKNLFIRGRITTTQILQGEQTLDDVELDILKNILELIKVCEQVNIIYGNSR